MLLALVLVGVAHYHLRQVWQGETAFDAAVRKVNKQQFQPAETDLSAALKISPQNAHYYAHKAVLLARIQPRGIESLLAAEPVLTAIEQQQLREAVECYERVLQFNPDDDFAYHNLAWLHFLLKEDDQAIACLRKAISLDSAVPLYHVSLGLQRERRGDRETAAAEFKTALRLSPGLLDSLFFHDLQLRADDMVHQIISDLIREFERQLERSFDPVVAGKLAKLYLDRSPELALPLLKRATETLPNLARPWANLALYFERNGDEELARSCYEKALFIDGSDAVSWYRLALYFDRRNQTAAAANCYERAVKFFSDAGSTHSTRVRRIYLSYFTLFDDVIPNGLSSYLMAGFDLRQACRRLSQINAPGTEVRMSACSLERI